jgi:hypothetical protein
LSPIFGGGTNHRESVTWDSTAASGYVLSLSKKQYILIA